MGVIHKLKEDIVSFIVTLKKNNPSLGVRQLAVLTSEQFHVQVSKSSVNSVLKRSALSSSVGRRPGSGSRSEKFSIPAVKKTQISKSMEETGFLKEDISFGREKIHIQNKKEQIVQAPAKEEKKLSLSPATFKEEEILSSRTLKEEKPAKERPSKEEKPDTKDFTARIEEERRRKKSRGMPISNGSGFVFLKAAQWDVSQRSLMAELFAKYIKSPVSKHFDSVSDMFLFFKFLGVESFDHISAYRGHGLWVLNNFCNSNANESKDLLELQELFQWDKTIGNAPSLPDPIMAYKRLKEQAFLEVKGFKLLLEDRSELGIDASMVSFGGGGLIPLFSYSSLPIHKAMARLSNSLISNIQSAIFHRAPGEARFDRAFYDMVAVFENISGKRILRATVIDQQDGEIAGFSTVPFQKRTFMVGVGPQQKEFSELTKAVKWPGKKSFYHAGTDRVVHFAETKTGFLAAHVNENIGDFRVITVWKDKESDPCWAILTNQKRKSGERILKAYMSQWPYLGETLQEYPVLALSHDTKNSKTKEEKGEKKKESDIFNDFIEALHGYCQDHFFPSTYAQIDISHLIANIHGVPGILYENEDTLSVFLDVEKGSVYRKDLEHAVKRVNERHILDYSGRRLWLEI